MKISFSASVLDDKITEFTDDSGTIISRRYLILYPEDSRAVVKLLVPLKYKAPELGKAVRFSNVDMNIWNMNGKSGVSFKLNED